MIYDAGLRYDCSKETFSGKGPARERLRTVKKQLRNANPVQIFSTAQKKGNCDLPLLQCKGSALDDVHYACVRP